RIGRPELRAQQSEKARDSISRQHGAGSFAARPRSDRHPYADARAHERQKGPDAQGQAVCLGEYSAVAMTIGRTAHIVIDPCRFVRQVKEIGWLELSLPNSSRPLPVHPAGESDFSATTVKGEIVFMRELIATKSDSPATQGGRGLIVLRHLK